MIQRNNTQKRISESGIKQCFILPLRPAMTTWEQSLFRAKAFAGPSWDTHIVFDGIIINQCLMKIIKFNNK